MLTIEDLEVVDVDSHVSEPTDLWTSRLSTKWDRDLVPHVEWDSDTQVERWKIGRHVITGSGQHAHAGWREFYPSVPPRLAEADRATWSPDDRLAKLDQHGIHAQVLYPNILGFYAHAFMEMEPELGLACVRAYNDFLTEFCSTDPHRLIAISALPFWDVDATVAEMSRCADMGHRGINFGWEFYKLG